MGYLRYVFSDVRKKGSKFMITAKHLHIFMLAWNMYEKDPFALWDHIINVKVTVKNSFKTLTHVL